MFSGAVTSSRTIGVETSAFPLSIVLHVGSSKSLNICLSWMN